MAIDGPGAGLPADYYLHANARLMMGYKMAGALSRDGVEISST